MTADLELLIDEPELIEIVQRLGSELSKDYPDGLILIGTLKGSIFFLADLMRQLSVPCEIDFLALSAYRPGETKVRILKDLSTDVENRDVVLVEGIIDTGLSTRYLISLLESRGTRTVAVCSLLDRCTTRILPVPVRYVGLEIGSEYVIGYGLDYAERYRNLRSIYRADTKVLTEDPDSFCYATYGAHSDHTYNQDQE